MQHLWRFRCRRIVDLKLRISEFKALSSRIRKILCEYGFCPRVSSKSVAVSGKKGIKYSFQSGKFWIRCEFGYVWTVVSAIVWLCYGIQSFPSEISQHGVSKGWLSCASHWQNRENGVNIRSCACWTIKSLSKALGTRVFVYPDTCRQWKRFVNGRGYFWIRKNH